MKLASFDIEIANEIPEGGGDWRQYAPLGIACAAVALGDSDEPIIWQAVPQMTTLECRELVSDLASLVDRGYTLVTWNGCSFDFAVLAEESDMYDECADLAMNHVDMMLMVTFKKGWRLGLQKALTGTGLQGKLKQVTRSDGTHIEDMDGAMAPRLWADGEYDAVLTYLRQDVAQTLELAHTVQRTGSIRWISRSGKPWTLNYPKLLTVQECLDLPEPDTSWMDDPPRRSQFLDWMPRYRDA